MKTLFFIALCLACVLVEVSSLDKPVNLDGSCPSGYYEDLALCYPNCRDGYYNV